eukprot:s292_g13.t1
MDVGKVVGSLQTFLRVRSQNMRDTSGFLFDAPARCWDADMLTGKDIKRLGRTGAREFVEKKAFVWYDAGTGDRWYGMRRSLYRFADAESPEPYLLEEGEWLGGLSEETLRFLVKLFTCQTLADASFLLQRLGVRNTTEELLRFCQRYSVVVVPIADHTQGACVAGCGQYMTNGCCEHVYAAYVHMQIIDDRIPAKRDVHAYSRRMVTRRRQHAKGSASTGRSTKVPCKDSSEPAADAASSSSAKQSAPWVKDAIREEKKYLFFEKQQQLRDAKKAAKD